MNETILDKKNFSNQASRNMLGSTGNDDRLHRRYDL
jgi:hypothetical protein